MFVEARRKMMRLHGHSLHIVTGPSLSGKTTLVEAGAAIARGSNRCAFCILIVEGASTASAEDKLLHACVPLPLVGMRSPTLENIRFVTDEASLGSADVVGWASECEGVVVVVVDSPQRAHGVMLCIEASLLPLSLLKNGFDSVVVFVECDEVSVVRLRHWFDSGRERLEHQWFVSQTHCTVTEGGIELATSSVHNASESEGRIIKISICEEQTKRSHDVEQWLLLCAEAARVPLPSHDLPPTPTMHTLPAPTSELHFVVELSSDTPMSFFLIQRFFESLLDDREANGFVSAKAVVVVPKMCHRVVFVHVAAHQETKHRCSTRLSSVVTSTTARITFRAGTISEHSLRSSFLQCIASEQLEYDVGRLVAVNVGEWALGRVIKHWDEGNAYRVRVFDGEGNDVWAPIDSKSFIHGDLSSFDMKVAKLSTYAAIQPSATIVLPVDASLHSLYNAVRSCADCFEGSCEEQPVKLISISKERTVELSNELLLKSDSSSLDVYRKLLTCDKDLLQRVSRALSSALPKGCGVRGHRRAQEDDTRSMASTIVSQAYRRGYDEVVSSLPEHVSKLGSLLASAEFHASYCEDCPIPCNPDDKLPIERNALMSLCSFLRFPLRIICNDSDALRETIVIPMAIRRLLSNRIFAVGFYCFAQQIPLRYLRQLMEQLLRHRDDSENSIVPCVCREKMGLCSTCLELLDHTMQHLFCAERPRADLWASVSQVRYSFNTPQCHSYSYVKDSQMRTRSLVSLAIHNVTAIAFDPQGLYFSPEFSTTGNQWRILLTNCDNALGVFLCTAKKKLSRACVVTFEVWVVNQASRDFSVRQETTAMYKANVSQQQWGFNRVISFSELFGHNEYLMAGGELQIDVALTQVVSDGGKQDKKNTSQNSPAASPGLDESLRNTVELLALEELELRERKLRKLCSVEATLRASVLEEASQAHGELRRKHARELAVTVKRQLRNSQLQEKAVAAQIELRLTLFEAMDALSQELKQLDEEILAAASDIAQEKIKNNLLRGSLSAVNQRIEQARADHLNQSKVRSHLQAELARMNGERSSSSSDVECEPADADNWLVAYLESLAISQSKIQPAEDIWK